MDMGRVVRWSRKLSVNKVAWFLRSWYVFLPACCFLPEMEGFSDEELISLNVGAFVAGG